MIQSKRNFLKIALTLCLLTPGLINAREIKNVPLDPSVRYGKLENGLTYYIKHNEKPENRAEFYLVVDVGAILETDGQDGLAHFVEHMCFNGTKNFPGKGILNYFETVGMEFGRNINAGTGLEQTMYMLMETPVTREGIIDTALLALKDMSHNVLFTEEEIDNERGVIHEEWRTRRDANWRLKTATDPIMYKDSKYAERDIIGELEVIDHCPYDTLRQFYKDWYRTDLQAIIVVGDIDVDQIETKIQKFYADIPRHKNPKERITYDVPDNSEPLIAIATDKEAQNTEVNIYFKHNYIRPEDKDIQYYINNFAVRLYTNMLNERLNELVQKENPPFIFAYNYYGNFAGNKDSYALGAYANNDVEYGLKSLLIENERVKQHGFTQGELERSKTDMLRMLEKNFKEKDQQQNRRLARAYASHFLRNSPTPGSEFSFELAKKVLPTITLEQVNELSKKWITNKNMVITITGPEKEDIIIPAEEKVFEVLNNVKTASIEPYVDKVSNKPLIASIPERGKITETSLNKSLEITEFTLSNNVKIVIKPTDFKEDEIVFTAFSNGGTSLYSDENLPSAEFATTIVNRSGIAGFSLIELQKMLTGKVVNVNPYINNLYEGFSGNCSPEDLETAMQLIYLYFTNPRFDEAATNAFMSRIMAFLQNKSLNPDAVFRDSVQYILADRHPRALPENVEKLQKIKFEKSKEVYLDRFADASDFTFVFTGNIDIEKAKPLFETYLGSLPSTKRTENWKDNEVNYPEGKVHKVIEKELEVKKNSIFINFNGDFEYTYENRILMQAIKHILDIRYTESVREDEGGTYGVGIRAATSEYPTEEFALNINFDCGPENSDKLKAIIYKEIDDMIKNGPSEVDLNKAKENFIKRRENALKENRFWLNSIVFNLKHDENILDHEKYYEMVNSLTVDKVKAAAEKYLTQGNIIEIIMTPTN